MNRLIKATSTVAATAVMLLGAPALAYAETAPTTTTTTQSSTKQVPNCSDVDKTKDNGECFTPTTSATPTKTQLSKSASAATATLPPGCVNDGTMSATEVTLTACSYVEGNSHAGVTADLRAKIHGRDQVSWMHPHHATPATPRLIRNAPLVHTNAGMTSATLWRLSGHEEYVRIFGDWRNDGRLGHIKAGFVAHAALPGDIMVYNHKSHKYEHGYTLKRPGTLTKDDQKHFLFWSQVKVKGSWVKVAVIQSCFNDFHGHVDIMVVNPVQVESEGKVIHKVHVHADSSGVEHVEGSLVCASGTLTGWATVAASGSDDIDLSVMLQDLLKATGDAEATALATARGNAKAGYQSVAFAQIHLQCSDTPVAPAPDVTLDTMNQVIETKSATTNLGVQVYGGDTATVTISTLWGQIYTTKTFNSVSGSWNTTIGYTAPGEIPDGSQSFPDTPTPPANYDQVRVVVVDNKTGKKVVTYTNVKITPFIPAP